LRSNQDVRAVVDAYADQPAKRQEALFELARRYLRAGATEKALTALMLREADAG